LFLLKLIDSCVLFVVNEVESMKDKWNYHTVILQSMSLDLSEINEEWQRFRDFIIK
jgi:hypothetical protein